MAAGRFKTGGNTEESVQGKGFSIKFGISDSNFTPSGKVVSAMPFGPAMSFDSCSASPAVVRIAIIRPLSMLKILLGIVFGGDGALQERCMHAYRIVDYDVAFATSMGIGHASIL
jgi:hypothetical protein